MNLFIENIEQTNIGNILTIAEASYRWNVTENTIKSRLRMKRASERKIEELRYFEKIGYIKYFKIEKQSDKETRGTWLVSKPFMEYHFGEAIHTEEIHAISNK